MRSELPLLGDDESRGAQGGSGDNRRDPSRRGANCEVLRPLVVRVSMSRLYVRRKVAPILLYWPTLSFARGGREQLQFQSNNGVGFLTRRLASSDAMQVVADVRLLVSVVVRHDRSVCNGEASRIPR
jgi:hypothetical protein